MKKVSLMQPSFLPWAGFYELIDSVDTFVLLDDFQFSRQGWGQRNRLLTGPNQISTLSLPISHPKDLNATFLDIKDANPTQWRRKFLTTIRYGYSKTLFFEPVYQLLEDWLSRDYPHIAALESELLNATLRYVGISTPVILSSALHTRDLKRSQRVLEILRKTGATDYFCASGSFGYMKTDSIFPVQDIRIHFQNHEPVVYPQIGSKTFIPYLGGLDILFNIPPDEFRTVIRGTKKWLTWEERAQKEILKEIPQEQIDLG